MAVLIGTTLDIGCSELLKVVKRQTIQIARMKTLLKRLEKTLNTIEPIFRESSRLSKALDRPEQETMMLILHLEEGKELVLKCSRIKFWNVYQRFVCSNKLIQLNKELLSFFQIDLPALMLINGMRHSMEIQDATDRMVRALSAVCMPPANQGSCGVPGLPEHIVGFHLHLQELRRRLLDHHTRVLLVSGPGGCGKTTLAKMLCHDDDIKGMFGNNILYVTISRQSSLQIIIQKLFAHLGVNPGEFQTDEDARNQLENLIMRMGFNKMLLVLDDVWPESVSIVDHLMFHTVPGYKILVTSRFVFPRYSSTYKLGLLNDDDAKTLICHIAFPQDMVPINVTDDLVNKIVKFCKGLPLALTVVGASLCGQPVLKWKITLKKWLQGGSFLQSNNSVLLSLKTSVDALDDESPAVKEWFLDLGLFPEDERISPMILMDMWVELYNLDDEDTSDTLLELSSRNLINLVPLRKDAGELDGYCNELYVIQHDMLRDLAIHLCNQEPVAERNRVFIEIHNNEFPTWWNAQTKTYINARILSISTDKAFLSSWYDLKAPKAEVLTLNIRSERYTLPEFVKTIGQLKILSITSYSDYPSELHNLSLLGCSSNLTKIRFEHVSVSSIQHIFELRNLRKLSFVMCEIGKASMTFTTQSPTSNLTDLEIDMCYDLTQLPSGLCNLVHLQKLSITNCQELDVLPKGLGSLSNLEILRLHCCTKLQELPESIGSLRNLSFIDISDCLSITALPEKIGELCGLRVLKMNGCNGLQELPVSVSKLLQLEDVICDEETSYLWRHFESDLPYLKIKVLEDDKLQSFMKIVQ